MLLILNFSFRNVCKIFDSVMNKITEQSTIVDNEDEQSC